MSGLGQIPDYLTVLDDEDNEFDHQHHTENEEHTLPLGVIEQQENSAVQQLIHTNYRRDAALARDVAYLGGIDIDFVLQNHNLTLEELKEKLKVPFFKKMVEKFQDEIGDDGSGMLQVRARSYMDVGITRLHQVVMSPDTKDENVVKAFTLMSQLSGAMPKNGAGEATGMQVVFNFGEDNPMIKARTIIEGDSNE